MTGGRTFSGAAPRTILPRGSIDTQMHMYMPGFPSAPGSIALPPAAPGPDEYRQVMQWLGIDRVVITQGNAHGRDNANVLASIAAMGECARGVAVIDRTTSDAEMERLSRGGVVGARIMDLPGGAVRLDELEAVDVRAAAAGWFIAVQFDGSHILAHEPRLAALRSRWVLDHHGKFFSGARPDGPEVDAVKRLIDRGNCWFKFAGCYESSKAGPPYYEDIGTVARTAAAYAPERIVWGTNWPHNSARLPDEYPDDAALLDLVLGWLPNDAARHHALIDGPLELCGWKEPE